MDVALLLFLIILNGILAMSEIAVVSSRQSRLQKLAEDGHSGARSALVLQQEPSTFLSTVQVGITTVGILSGAIGEAALAAPLADWLRSLALPEPHADAVAMTVVVVGVTYCSVVVGELVPKRLGLLAPERVASLVARPMGAVSRLARPLVWLLSSSSSLLLRLLGARRTQDSTVTDDEIKVLMGQGAEAGVFHASEQAIVSNVLRLDEQRISAIMTHRKDIYVLDLNAGEEEIRRRLADSPYRRIVVCRDGLDRIVGVLRTSDLLKGVLLGQPLAVEAFVRPALYVPASVTTTQLLETFRRAHQQCALMVDEYGGLQGLVTLTDVLTSIVGDLPTSDAPEELDIVVREDGSWLADGSVPIERLKGVLGIHGELPGEDDNAFNTLGGFVMYVLGRIPLPADHFTLEDLRFEVVDMDRHRVDKVLIARSPGGEPSTANR
ncbi:MAG TPA: hemolysin family protein [Candidatus Accumulibacter phosphatis]|nr:MAG: Hemolysin C [Candidatus Accumulibacter sp. SK-11]HAY28646.1 HlyC/CorC family transporter [Accumulibacter sp.]HRL76005.1 hemolysin family protein [Candidatus Accumulibacter phosphatis]HCN67039.1 HlyC/CorC family transporter [Accumulibacter sp.]HCV12316.1 HlyC/CorC family transporter [Accumulibacter sp.]